MDQSRVLTEPQLTLWDAQEQLSTIEGVLPWLRVTASLEPYMAQSLDGSHTGKRVILDVSAAETELDGTEGRRLAADNIP